MGIVVTEARKKSGAKITTAFALEQNREVFAVPGRVDSAQAQVLTVWFRVSMLSWSAVQKIFWRNYHLFLPLQPIFLFLLKETGFKKMNPDDLGEKQSRILKALNDGDEEIDTIY